MLQGERMESIKSLLGKTLKINKPAWHHKLITEWHDVVGNLANIMTLEKVHGTTLVIGLYEHSWAQELYMLSDVIIKTINQHLDQPVITKLYFRLANSADQQLPEIVPLPTDLQPRAPIPLTSREQQALNGIEDEDLKTALSAFLTRCKYQTSLPKKKKTV